MTDDGRRNRTTHSNVALALAALLLLPSCNCGTPVPEDGDASDAGQLTDAVAVSDRAIDPDAAAADHAVSSDAAPSDLGAALDHSSPPDQAVVDGGALADSAQTADASRADAAQPPLIGLPYPTSDTYMIKGIQPDFWPVDTLTANNTGVVAMNMVWDIWEPQLRAPPCDASTEEEYDGHCFRIDQNIDQAIAAWTQAGVRVTGIVYGVPEWARLGNIGCSPISAGFVRFCTPDDAADYGRFAGMIARRYDGLRGHGRVADFVIHNEVNSNIWFDIGCGQGVACDQDLWIQTYVDSYAAAYDLIKAHQSEAKVLLSFEHHFDIEFDRPADDNAMLSVKTFVTTFDQRIGDRQWQLAYHPYAPDLLSSVFSPFDLPRVTYGNLGVILGWLRAAFPDKPYTWEVQLTESGVNSSAPRSSEAAQAVAVCDSLYNVLATPGVTSYIYHRMQDHPTEGELQLGLARTDGSLKPAWGVWARSNLYDAQPPELSCGFEELPYTRLRRGFKIPLLTARVHWASSRLLPEDFEEEASWRLLRDQAPGTQLLFECQVDNAIMGPHNLLTLDPTCEGLQTLGPVGYIWTSQVPDSVPLYRCRSDSPADHFVSTDAGCEGATQEQLLGYALP